MTDLETRLATAVTDMQALKALMDAIDLVWPIPKTEPPKVLSHPLPHWNYARSILEAHPAGWLGIGVLMLPEGFCWAVGNGDPEESRAVATLTRYKTSESRDGWHYHEHTFAKRTDCALALGDLKARGLLT